MDDLDARRARSFGPVAAAYAEHRPDYPDAAVDWALKPVAGRPGLELLDLGAGTGKLTASLIARASKVTAVEPDSGMLAELRRLVPAADARAGSAEAIPLPDASVDAVLAGQALHWFDPVKALPEIARVLRPGGVFAGLWNADDASVAWVKGYHRAAWRERSVPGVPQGGDRPALPTHPAFRRERRREFAHRQERTVDGLIAVLGTHSWALVSSPDERDAAFERVRAYLATRPETASDRFVLPLRTMVLRVVRR